MGGQEILTLCWVLVPDAEMIAPAYILLSMESVEYPPFFNIAFSREVARFFSYDPQAKLRKRKVIDFVPGK